MLLTLCTNFQVFAHFALQSSPMQLYFCLLCAVAYAENPEGGAKFRHNRVISQINFRTTILGASGGMPPGKCKITPKNTQITPKNAHLHLKIRILLIIFFYF